ncbi:MAG: secondary thiamine-phosphate synthase enzyme YjbQ [Anaerolineae bacterium]
MIIKLEKLTVQSRREQELIDVTPLVEEAVAASGVTNGLVNIINLHTSAGVVVTEGIECLERDVLAHLARLAPEEGEYWHNRYLDFDGRLGFNAHAHLRSILSGYFAMFPIADGKLIKGGRQRVYFAEYDGPLSREVLVQILGE